MLLRSITLHDFGLYAGRQTMSLLPRTRHKKERPIILIGGNNGAGKTSLLDAVRLTLYGKLALGARVSQSDYNAYLKSRIHVPPASVKGKPASASITLEFDYSESGHTHRYEVIRAWAVRGQSVVESLDITKDGSEITSVPREEWHFFLQDLLPPGVSQLFFFDGEKITDIAEDNESDEHLSHAIRALLGIELVSRLRTDLGLFISRQERANVDDSAGRLDEVVRDHGRLGEELSTLREQVAELRTQFDGQERAAEKAQQRFVAAGGDVAMRVGEFRGERDQLLKRQAVLLTQIREGSGALWPLALAPKLLTKVLASIPGSKQADLLVMADRMRAALTSWLDQAPDAGRKRWAPATKHDFEEVLKLATQPLQSQSGWHPIAAVPNGRERLEQALSQSAIEAGRVATEYAESTERLRAIETALARVDETTTDFRLEELRAAEQACGATRNEIETAEAKIKDLTYRQTVLDRERARILSEQSDKAQSDRRLGLASRTSKVLAAYESALVKQKTRALEKAFVECFNRLARKGDLVRGVRIDDSSFQATLVDAGGQEIPKRLLSAGEKQIYAIAMLWALAKTSGRNLPVIIDTPLARLDSEHRANIIGRYLPEVSHQVIVLSTDTEVDVEVVATLEKHVSHSYLLDYIRKEGRTVAVPGYFEALKQEVGGRRALQQA